MKTIAISIDDDTLAIVDRLALSRSGGRRVRPNRSRVIREALRDQVLRWEKLEREERERQIFAKRRVLLARQTAALVAEQAELI